MIKNALILFMAMLITGCAGMVKTEIKEVPVYKVEYVYVTVPSHLLKLNPIPAPPGRSVYANASCEVREELLIKYSQELITEMKMCLADKKAITSTMNEKVKSAETPKKETTK